MSWLLIAERILLDIVLHIIFFPVWWYTHGAKNVLIGCVNLIQNVNRQFAPGLWAKNLFVPMFGQSDWQGRITSFVMRLVNIIFRSFLLAVWSVLVAGLFILWLLIPLLAMFFIILSFAAQFSV